MNKSSESMTSGISSTNEDWIKDIDADGFIFLIDSAVGEQVEEFAENGWPRTTIEVGSILPGSSSSNIEREPIPVHPPGLHVHPPLLTRTPPRGNLKFPLRITQLHTKFSRQFKSLHMILKSFNFVFKELQYRCFSTSFATYETLQTGLHPFGWKGVWQHGHLAALHLAALHLLPV